MLDIYPRATYNSQPYLLRGTAQELQRASAVRLYSQLFVAGVKAMPQEVRRGRGPRFASFFVHLSSTRWVRWYAYALVPTRGARGKTRKRIVNDVL